MPNFSKLHSKYPAQRTGKQQHHAAPSTKENAASSTLNSSFGPEASFVTKRGGSKMVAAKSTKIDVEAKREEKRASLVQASKDKRRDTLQAKRFGSTSSSAGPFSVSSMNEAPMNAFASILASQ